MLALHTHARLLIQLNATLYWRTNTDKSNCSSSSSNSSGGGGGRPEGHILRAQKLAPVAFAADVMAIVDDNDDSDMSADDATCSSVASAADLFLRSLDARCLDQVRTMTRRTPFRFDKPADYEVERAFVWAGMMGPGQQQDEGGGGVIFLPVRGLSATELGRQIDMVRRRGYRDWVRVDMAVEIEPSEELRRRGEASPVAWVPVGNKNDGQNWVG
ncbi:hypothetical protein VTI28DRAFT_4463 [Corynascus sepedonium]